MSVDYRIIAPQEAEHVLRDPREYDERTSLGPFRPIWDWLKGRADRWHFRNPTTATVGLGPASYAVLDFHTPSSRAWVDAWSETGIYPWYTPSDDEPVTSIGIECRYYSSNEGSFSDAVLADLAEHVGGVIFDHQSSEILSPAEFRSRSEDAS